ncbi:SAM-dependent methyltransferase [Roseivirga sp. E12]|uniref:class I SAM-dependent methyltransferase n=1 Tax=Roseivirga sp. E12 TaxID=2819237 RepID=UPI001ABC9609|nr:SAM-dependent methyltransferase [Roseivirga sp. E12]MBO3698621.1 SAM-dependent methyltransferase [Roseivirga sp. E12]
MSNEIQLLQHVNSSIQEDTFVRLTLSKPIDSKDMLKKVIISLATIKRQSQLSFVYRHKTNDVTKNQQVQDGLSTIEDLLNNKFEIANLFTTASDYAYERSGAKSRLKQKEATFKSAPNRGHDKEKRHLIQGVEYLQLLGVLDKNGRVLKDKGDKFKQINKFVEVIESLLKNHEMVSNKDSIKVVDMGSGKGYLTFALYDYLTNQLKLDASVSGVEVRQDLIDKCNSIAKEVGFDKLQFELGYIGDYQLNKTNILIALHACDTATDDAIAKGMAANAELIICAPCCHKQIRKSMTESDGLDSLLQHGILKERQAEIVTDAIRALIMEANGYKTKVFEFISTEHTGKNLMIVGQRKKQATDPQKYLGEIDKLKKQFGIPQHYLESLV